MSARKAELTPLFFIAMIMRKIFTIACCFLLISCAVRKSTRNNPEILYKQGKQYLKAGEPEKAEETFLGIQSVDPQFAPAYEGLGNTYLYQNKLKLAEVFFKKAIEINNNWLPAYTGLGKLFYLQNDYGNALRFLKGAEEKSGDNFEIFYYLGMTYKKLKDYSQAKVCLENALNLEPGNEDVKKELASVTDYLAGKPAYPSFLEPIEKIRQVNRGEFAVFIDYVLGSERFYSLFEDNKTGSILDEHALGNYKDYVKKILKTGLLTLYPDNSYRFNEKISKSFLAVVLQSILIAKTGNRLIETMYLDSSSPFSDISSSHYAYNAVMVAVTRGIMKGKLDGTFGISDLITGKELLEILNKLKEELRL